MPHTEGKMPLGEQVERRAILDAVWAAAFGTKFAAEMDKPWDPELGLPDSHNKEKHAGYEAAIRASQAVHAAEDHHLDEHLAEISR